MTQPLPRLLLISPVSPLSTAAGSEQRSHLLLQALAALGEVDIIHLSEAASLDVAAVEDWSADFSGIAGRGRLLTVQAPAHRLPWQRFHPQPALRKRIEAALGRSLGSYALVVGRYLWPLCQLDAPALPRTLVDLDDWRYRTAPGAPSSWADWSARLRKAYASRLAQSTLSRFSAAFAVSELDAAELAGALPVTRLPNVPIRIPEQVQPVPAGGHCLFVGSLWYRPNVQAIEWLLSQVWPKVQARRPQAQLLIVGAAAPELRQRWSELPGVSAPGFVDDLDQAYAQSSLVLAPVFSGGGSNIKVLEALAHGRPCLVTPLAEGPFSPYLQPGLHLGIAFKPEHYASEILQALEAPRREQASAGRQQVIEHFSAGLFIDIARETARRLLPS